MKAKVKRLNDRKGFFITGTDTDAGKTFVATRLLAALNEMDYTTAAIKPIASGCDDTENGLRNDDALKLQQAASLKFPYDQVNPFSLAPPIAPHIAAKQVNLNVTVDSLMQACQPILSSPADYVIVEGAGGWQVPLNEKEYWRDFCRALQLPIILVVGMKLGCINHTLLTWESIHNAKLPIAGWIANCVNPSMRVLTENIETLKQRLPIPLLSVVNFNNQKISKNSIEWISAKHEIHQ